jgi:hypothetical protein
MVPAGAKASAVVVQRRSMYLIIAQALAQLQSQIGCRRTGTLLRLQLIMRCGIIDEDAIRVVAEACPLMAFISKKQPVWLFNRKG